MIFGLIMRRFLEIRKDHKLNLFDSYHELTRVWSHPFMLQAKKEKDIVGMVPP
jgi:hypothetical protein